MRRRRTGHRLSWPAALGVALAVFGCADADVEGRSRAPALDLADARGLPGALDTSSTWAVYLVHVPESATEAFEQAEIAFALTDGGYEMEAMEVGLAGPMVRHWLRFGIVQDLAIAPLGARYLLEPGGVEHVYAHGFVDGIEYSGLSTDVRLEADLSTGAVRGDFRLQLGGQGGPDHHLELAFTGQLDRDCAGWIYRPGLDISVVRSTGGPCAAVFARIDAAGGRDQGPELPPGFVPPARELAE